MSRALVTGASGFIGRHLCERLLGEGTEVHGVSRASRDDGDITWWRADLTDPASADELFERIRPDGVFHLAGYVSGSRSLDAVLPALQQIALVAVNVFVAAARTGCGFVVHAGSLEEPDERVEGPIPVSPYAAAKFATGAYARMLHALHDLPVVTLRLFMVYGPGQDDHTKLVPYVVTSLLRGEKPLLSSGARAVDWVYVDDVVDAFLAARRPDLAGETVDVGSGELVTVRSVVDRIVQTIGTDIAPDFGAIPERQLERIRAADVERTQSLIGWEPRTSLAKGIEATVESYRALHARDPRNVSERAP